MTVSRVTTAQSNEAEDLRLLLVNVRCVPSERTSNSSTKTIPRHAYGQLASSTTSCTTRAPDAWRPYEYNLRKQAYGAC